MEDAFAASVGGLISSVTVYPFDVVRTKLQLKDKGTAVERKEKATSPVQTFLEILNHEGVLGFYRGVEVKALLSMIQKFLFAFNYDAIKHFWVESGWSICLCAMRVCNVCVLCTVYTRDQYNCWKSIDIRQRRKHNNNKYSRLLFLCLLFFFFLILSLAFLSIPFRL